MSPRALACPASLKGVLSAAVAAEALVRGFGRAGVGADAMPVADGGEGTLDALCSRSSPSRRGRRVRPAADCAHGPSCRTGRAVVEAAEAIPLDPSRLDVMAASSRGLGELDRAARGRAARRHRRRHGDDGRRRGLLEVLGGLPAADARRSATWRRAHDAPRLFGPQKGARPRRSPSSRRGFAAIRVSRPTRPARFRRGRRPGRRARLARRRARPRRGDRARPARLRSGGLRPRRHRRGDGRRDDVGGQGAGRGRAALRRRRTSAASSSADCVRQPATPAGAQRRPVAGRADLVELGERLGRPGSAARSRFAIPWSSSHASAAFSSTSGWNSQEASP